MRTSSEIQCMCMFILSMICLGRNERGRVRDYSDLSQTTPYTTLPSGNTYPAAPGVDDNCKLLIICTFETQVANSMMGSYSVPDRSPEVRPH